MKKYLPSLLLLCGIILLQSCLKQPPETKYVTINESVQSGDTYSLDLAKYADSNAEVSITTQAIHYTISQVDRDPSSRRYVYHYSTDTKQAQKEKVVINLTKSGGGGCHNSSKENKTVVTLNLDVLQ